MERVGLLVVDAGPLIKGASLESWSKNVVTIREVVAEIRDANTLQRLQVLPYDLSFREPSQQSLQFVREFSKKTGDYQSLSSVDLKLIALTYQLECEEGPNKGTNIKREPIRYSKENVSPEVKDVTDKIQAVAINDSIEDIQGAAEETETEILSTGILPKDINNNIIIDQSEEERDSVSIDTNNSLQCTNNSESNSTGDENEVEDEGVADDEDGWITPSNIEHVRKSMGGAFEEEAKSIAVGCITTDYAIQNVLLQMGLNVVSMNGMLIKRLQTYALKCKACFKTVYKCGKYFCPFCGNRTLIKVRMEVDSDGNTRCFPLSGKQFSHKGLRYSLPLPKGGRRPNMPLVSPNQRTTFRLPRSREKIDPLDPDYIARDSPFRSKDVTSRGAQIAFKQGKGRGRPQEGWRRNPNQVKKSRK